MNDLNDLTLVTEIFEQIKGVLIIDSEARIIYINKTWSTLLGVDQDKVIGTPVREIIHDTKMDAVLKTGIPDYGDVFLFNGEYNVCSRIPIFKDGKIIAVFGFSIFDNLDIAKDFRSRLNDLMGELDYYKDEVRKLRGSKYSINNILGESECIVKLKKQIYDASKSSSTVLIQGETGSGKELVVHSIHALSKRSLQSLIKLNCAAIPEELIESELFGYEEGTFTGAKRGGKAGKFQMANKGTLFLDEIDQLPLKMQSKLLRVLQEREVDRIGSDHSIPIDVRIIVASNNDLEKLAKENLFRTDLFYRLNVIRIVVPPLRERKDDILIIVEEIIRRLNKELGINVTSISKEAIANFQKYNWPGNVRELQNVIERAMNKTYSGSLEIEDFEWLKDKTTNYKDIKDVSVLGDSLTGIKVNAEREAIVNALKSSNGNKTEAAKILKIARPTLYNKIKKFGIRL